MSYIVTKQTVIFFNANETAQDFQWLQMAVSQDFENHIGTRQALQNIACTHDRLSAADGFRIHSVNKKNNQPMGLYRINDGKPLRKTKGHYLCTDNTEEHNYPNLDRVFPKMPMSYRVTVELETLLSETMGKHKTNEVRLSFYLDGYDKRMCVDFVHWDKDSNERETKHTSTFKLAGDSTLPNRDFDIYINRNYFIDALLMPTDGTFVDIHLDSPTSPVVIEDNEKGEYKVVVMPLIPNYKRKKVSQ